MSFWNLGMPNEAGRRWRWIQWPIAGMLVTFNLRRLLYTFVALRRPLRRARQAMDSDNRAPLSVLVLVPCRNEAATLPGLIDSLERLAYTPGCLQVALVDDGSTDETQSVMKRAAETHGGWHVIRFEDQRGKAHALNGALEKIAYGDVIVVYDVDHRPEPESLERLMAAFSDVRVAGASGRTIHRNAAASWPAYYAAVESLVHQMITMRAKDRLALAPALLGSNCAYRRAALQQVGGFLTGALLEDSDMTLAFARHGYRLRFVPDSVTWHQAPETVGDYVRQHRRWARGFNDVVRNHAVGLLAERSMPLGLRIELILFALGYLDRLALVAALGMSLIGGIRAEPTPQARRRVRPLRRSGILMPMALMMPFVQIVAVFVAERVPRGMWLRLPALPVLFGLDIWAAVRGALDSIARRPRAWTPTRRPSE